MCGVSVRCFFIVEAAPRTFLRVSTSSHARLIPRKASSPETGRLWRYCGVALYGKRQHYLMRRTKPGMRPIAERCVWFWGPLPSRRSQLSAI